MAGFFLLGASCNSGKSSAAPVIASSSESQDIHKVVVKEVLQTTKYTYLLVDEGGTENWLALPKMEAQPGETYYYRNGFRMTDFDSKELGRRFAVVYFLESISKSTEMVAGNAAANPHKMQVVTDTTSAAGAGYQAEVKIKKADVAVETPAGSITIADLYGKKDKYSGQKVKVTGKVTKFNDSILKRNWIHLQDGTTFEGKFDLTVTCNCVVTVGDVITVEGVLAVGKDFGYGYAYELLVEDAQLISK